MDKLIEYLLTQTKDPKCPISGVCRNFDRNVVIIHFKDGMLIELTLHKENKYEARPFNKSS